MQDNDPRANHGYRDEYDDGACITSAMIEQADTICTALTNQIVCLHNRAGERGITITDQISLADAITRLAIAYQRMSAL
jgi:hypothetical protein